MKRIVGIFLLLSFPFLTFADGLLFNGNDKLIEKRTSYRVFADEAPRFTNRMVVSFQLSVLKQDSFGNIFRLVDRNKGSVYSLVFARNNDTTSYIRFNCDDKENRITLVMFNSIIRKGHWFDITLDFMLDQDSLNISIDNHVCGVGGLNLPRILYPDIYFGKHDYSIDVLEMAIRDLTVTSQETTYHFPFNESSGSMVHDDKRVAIGKVENPVWMVNNSYYWKKRLSFHSSSTTGCVFDEKRQQILFFNQDSLFSYNVETELQQYIPYKNKLPFRMELGMGFYDTLRNRLFAYEVYGLSAGSPKVAAWDMSDCEWKVESYDDLPTQRHHHCSYYNIDQEKLLIFGGFGHQRYYNEFIEYDVKQRKWIKTGFEGDTIPPRMFPAMGIRNPNELYILGGAGNEQGEQSIGKVHYLDLYRIDQKNQRISRLWDLGENSKLVVPARQLMFTPDSTSVYALCYPSHLPHTHLLLHQFSLKDGNYKVLGDSVPMLSEAIRTNANLWFNTKTQEIFCATLEYKDQSDHVEVNLYSLQYPAIASLGEEEGIPGWKWGLTGLILLLGIGGIVLWRIKYKRTLHVDAVLVTAENPDFRDKNQYKNKKNAIYLFGVQAMFDRNGREISYLLSTKIRQLFCFILVNSDEKTGGVSSAAIYAAIWPDKPVQNAKNLKGVTITNLRKILGDLEGVGLVFENGKFILKMSPDFYCDYFEFLGILDTIHNASTFDAVEENVIQKFLGILEQGKFLEDVKGECFDELKLNLEDTVSEILYWRIEKVFEMQDYKEVIRISHLFLTMDALNEVALWYELQASYKLHNINAARRKYQSFVMLYQKNQNQIYPYSFERIIKSRIPGDI